jgi:hypothetical protein
MRLRFALAMTLLLCVVGIMTCNKALAEEIPVGNLPKLTIKKAKRISASSSKDGPAATTPAPGAIAQPKVTDPPTDPVER